MALEWLPSAVRDPHGRDLAWAQTIDPKGVLHTTETSGWPSYRDWLDAPHATVLPVSGKGVTIRQHIPFSRAGFALVHTNGQQVTNTDFAFQFELVGTSAQGGPGYYWPAADDAVLLDLYRKVIKPLSDAYGIPLHALPFKPYPASYGANGVRLTQGQWDVYTGWLGHQHVPENDHGDPGAFPWDRMMQLTQEDDMPSAAEIAEAILGAEFGGKAGSSSRKTLAEHILAIEAQSAPAVPTAQDIATALAPALVAAVKAVPTGTPGTAPVLDEAAIAKLVKAVWDEGATRLVR